MTTTATPRPPERASGVDLLGPMQGSGYVLPPMLVRRLDGQTVQLSPLLYEVLSAIDGQRSWDEVAAVVAERVVRPVTADDVEYLAQEKLSPAGLLVRPDGSQPAPRRSNPLLGLRWRLVVSNPRVTRWLVRPFAWLFAWWAVLPVLVAFGVATWWVMAERGLGVAMDDVLQRPEMLLLVVASTVISAAFHELGHAAACRYGGATPGAMGAALYLVWPVFWTDVTDSYRLDRRGRLRVDLGGLYFNVLFALGAVGLWAVTRQDALLVLLPVQLLQMLRQLIPLVRFDGYHILADLTGVPDLFARIKPILLGVVGRGDGSQQALRPWVRAVVTGWVLLVVPSLLALLVLAVIGLPSVLSSAGESIAFHVTQLRANLDAGDAVRVSLGVVAILTVGLVPLGMVYLLGRVSTRSATALWGATEGRPAARGLASVAVLGLLLATTTSWMPAPQPAGPMLASSLPLPRAAEPTPATIDPDRWTVAVEPAATERVAAPGRPLADSTARWLVLSGERLASLRGDRATTAQPTAAVVVAPVDDWPFPFDPPADARPGDNVVLAVNTVDGSSITDFVAQLSWLADEPVVDERNVAYAAASCVDCSTRAVAFQVVVATGRVDVAVPNNQAVAVNHICVGCTTEALAVQMMVTLEEMPSVETMEAVEALWAQVDALQSTVESAAIEVVHGELVRIQDEILTTLGVELPTADPDGPEQLTGPTYAERRGDGTLEPAPIGRRTAAATTTSAGPVERRGAVAAIDTDSPDQLEAPDTSDVVDPADLADPADVADAADVVGRAGAAGQTDVVEGGVVEDDVIEQGAVEEDVVDQDAVETPEHVGDPAEEPVDDLVDAPTSEGAPATIPPAADPPPVAPIGRQGLVVTTDSPSSSGERVAM